MFPAPEVLAARQKLVLDHFHDEVVQDWDDVLSTFPHPHYELITADGRPTTATTAGGYYDYTRTAFPDQDRWHHRAAPQRGCGDRRVLG